LSGGASSVKSMTGTGCSFADAGWGTNATPDDSSLPSNATGALGDGGGGGGSAAHGACSRLGRPIATAGDDEPAP